MLFRGSVFAVTSVLTVGEQVFCKSFCLHVPLGLAVHYLCNEMIRVWLFAKDYVYSRIGEFYTHTHTHTVCPSSILA